GRDEAHGPELEQQLELPPQRREPAGLDLHEEVAPHEVDDEPGHALLEPVARAAVPLLQLRVQRALVERTDHAEGFSARKAPPTRRTPRRRPPRARPAARAAPAPRPSATARGRRRCRRGPDPSRGGRSPAETSPAAGERRASRP